MLFKFKCIKDNRIKQFSFKLFHRILPSKDNLFKWKLVSSNQCSVCKCQETIMHFLFDCKRVKVFWKIIERMMYYVFKTDIKIDNLCMIIGFDIAEKKNIMINVIINIAQYVIYKDYVKKLWEETRTPATGKELWLNF